MSIAARLRARHIVRVPPARFLHAPHREAGDVPLKLSQLLLHARQAGFVRAAGVDADADGHRGAAPPTTRHGVVRHDAARHVRNEHLRAALADAVHLAGIDRTANGLGAGEIASPPSSAPKSPPPPLEGNRLSSAMPSSLSPTLASALDSASAADTPFCMSLMKPPSDVLAEVVQVGHLVDEIFLLLTQSLGFNRGLGIRFRQI